MVCHGIAASQVRFERQDSRASFIQSPQHLHPHIAAAHQPHRCALERDIDAAEHSREHVVVSLSRGLGCIRHDAAREARVEIGQ